MATLAYAFEREEHLEAGRADARALVLCGGVFIPSARRACGITPLTSPRQAALLRIAGLNGHLLRQDVLSVAGLRVGCSGTQDAAFVFELQGRPGQ